MTANELFHSIVEKVFHYSEQPDAHAAVDELFPPAATDEPAVEAPDAPPAVDPRDAEIAELRAQLAAKTSDTDKDS